MTTYQNLININGAFDKQAIMKIANARARYERNLATCADNRIRAPRRVYGAFRLYVSRMPRSSPGGIGKMVRTTIVSFKNDYWEARREIAGKVVANQEFHGRLDVLTDVEYDAMVAGLDAENQEWLRPKLLVRRGL